MTQPPRMPGVSMGETPTESVLARLDDVRQTTPGQWVALCPAHDDRRPSLSIREGDDGRVLVYCFAGCGAADVVSAIGLEMADLFPPDLADDDNYDRRQWKRRPAPPIRAADALNVLDIESSVVVTMAHRLRDCALLTDQETADVDLAMQRIEAIRERWEESP